MPRTYKKSEQSKQLLMDAATALAQEAGYAGISIRAICERAGLSIGAFYHHFSSKEDVLNQSFLQFDRTITEERLAAYDRMDPVQALKAVLFDQISFTETVGAELHKQYYRTLFEHSGHAAVDRQRTYYRSVKRYAALAQKQGLLSEVLEAEELADYLVRHVRALLIDWCLHDGSYPLKQRGTQEVDLILRPFLTEKTL